MLEKLESKVPGWRSSEHGSSRPLLINRPRVVGQMPHVFPKVLDRPLQADDTSERGMPKEWRGGNSPALRISRCSSLLFNADHCLLDSQSSRPQQQREALNGSGDGTREKFDSAAVKSSIVAVALRRLLGEPGVGGLEVVDIVQVGDAAGRQHRKLCGTQ